MHNSRRPFSSRIVRENCDDDSNRNIQILNVYYYYYYNSFIQRPIRVALPAQPLSSNLVLRPEINRAKWPTVVRRSATGRPFQAIGPDTREGAVGKQSVYGGPVTVLAQKGAMRCDVYIIFDIHLAGATNRMPQGGVMPRNISYVD